MSRCFPFPPPGYQKKLRPEEDLLKEEKRKEKKQKKDKKDKGKREGKDKKERDKSDDKHKEKKDRKDKHRDKKEKHRDKKKDKGKDKEKSSISEDASITGQPETRSGGKLHTREEHSKDKSHVSDEKKFALQFQGQNGQNIGNRLLAWEIEESKFVQELGGRIRDEGKAMGSKPVERSSSADCRENQETQFPVRDPQNLFQDKGRNRDSRVGDGKVEAKRLRDEARVSGNPVVQNLAGSTECRDGGVPLPVQNETDRSTEGKDKSKQKSDDKRGDKRKDKEKKDKKGHGKNKGKEKDKKKEEKAKERTENKKNDQDKSKEMYRDEITSFNNNSSHLPTDINKNFTTGENLKKRKDVEANGFMHENELRPNKLSRPISHQLPENGRILEACQTSGLVPLDKKGIAFQDGTDNEHWVNGIIEASSLSVCNQRPPSAATKNDQIREILKKPLQVDQVVEAPRKLPQGYQVTEVAKKHSQADQITEPPRKPPHPDLKYLSEILSVPKMDEWSEVDDQKWLFNNKGPPSKKPEAGSSGSDTMPRVWSEGLHLEAADIYALPYVIPY